MAGSTATLWISLLAASGVLAQQLARAFVRLDLRAPIVMSGVAGLACVVAASTLSAA